MNMDFIKKGREREMIKSYDGKSPTIAPSAYVSQAALIIGDVEVGENCGVWPFAIVCGDTGKVSIGKDSHVASHCVLSGAVEIGDGTIIGYGAVLQSCKVGHRVFIGAQVTVLSGSEIGDNAIIGANAAIRNNSKIPARCLVTGVPARAIKILSLEQCQKLLAGNARNLTSLFKKYKEQAL